MDKIIQFVNEQMLPKKEYPAFGPGDTILINYRITEGNKQRIQAYKGVVIAIRGRGLNKTITVRKVSFGVGVERIFPLYSPYIESIELIRKGKVRRAKLYYLRNLKGKKAKIKEKIEIVKEGEELTQQQ